MRLNLTDSHAMLLIFITKIADWKFDLMDIMEIQALILAKSEMKHAQNVLEHQPKSELLEITHFYIFIQVHQIVYSQLALEAIILTPLI